MVRRHVPESDVEDIVQAALTEALSPAAPTDEAALQRWLFGVVRHKIADRHRRARRESFDLPEVHAVSVPHVENDLVRWAERALPEEGEDPRRTLEWMLREGDGEKLEAIAASERLPAPRVRKRVSRLREHLRAAWKKEVALLAALGVGIVILAVWWARRPSREPIARDPGRPVPSVIAPAPVPALAPSTLPTPTPAPSATPTPAPSATPTPAPSATPTSAPAPRSTSLSPSPSSPPTTAPSPRGKAPKSLPSSPAGSSL